MQVRVVPFSFRPASLLVAAFASILTLMAASSVQAQPTANSRVFATTSKPFGQSYAQWSAQWWKWALARPVTGHPFLDPGFDCNSAGNGQSGPVWFLATSGLQTPLVERTCNVPNDTAVMIALANAECSSLEPTFPDGTGGQTAVEQRDCANFFANHIVVSSLSCSIDGTPVANLGAFRFATSQFAFAAPTPWIFGDTGGSGTSVGDGYYVIVKPLSAGPHTLTCGGGFHFSVAEGDPFDADFGFGDTYHLNIGN